MEAINRGIHVLVEKPITATLEQADKLISAAQEKNVKLTVGHIERFNPAIQELKKRIDNGEIGDVIRVQSRRMGPFPARIRDVGVVIDLASHDVDIVRYIMNTEITRVYAETTGSIATDREDTMDAVLRCANNAIGTLNINWITPTKIRELTVTGASGMFLVNYLTQEIFFYENAEAVETWQSLSFLKGVTEGRMIRLKIDHQEPLKAELQSFAQAVRDDVDPLVSGADGKKALQIAQAIVRSGEEQVIVPIA
jgi:predicted dehydrogenase